MHFDSAIRCIPCSQRFDDDRKPCIGTCTHIICVPCKEKLKEFECPICDRVGAFKDVEPNYAALHMANQLHDQLKIGDLHAFTPTEQDINMGLCFNCKNHTSKLRLCTDCAQKDGLIKKCRGKWLLITENADYQKEFLKIKSTTICADCVFEGAHEGHRIEVLRDALKHNFVTKEQTEKVRRSPPMKADFASLKKLVEKCLFNIEKQMKWPPNPCVLGDEACCFIPELQAQIEEVRGGMKKEVRENEKLKERLYMYQLELVDLLIENFKRSGPKESEIQKLETIRLKYPKWKYLTEKDVLRIDEMLRRKMAQAGSVEAFEVARGVEQRVFDQKKKEMLKLQLKDDKAKRKYVNCSPDMSLPARNQVFLDYLGTSIILTRAHIQCELAFQDVRLNTMVGWFTRVTSMRLLQLPLFNQIPWNPSDHPSPYLNVFS